MKGGAGAPSAESRRPPISGSLSKSRWFALITLHVLLEGLSLASLPLNGSLPVGWNAGQSETQL